MITRNNTRIGLLLTTALFLSACGATASEETEAGQGTAEETTESQSTDDAMEDEAMEDGTDDAMEDGTDDAMEDGTGHDSIAIDITFDGLEPLGDDFDYELWSIVDGEALTGGRFDLDETGTIDSVTELGAHPDAATIVVTIEPTVGDDPAPSPTHVLAGDVDESGAFDLTIDHPAALGTDFAGVSGTYILGTPTDDPDGNELSGVWFLSLPGPEVGLDLPELPEGWVYEGWAVIDGVPVTTGRFTSADGADDFDGFSGSADGPPFPGEDFIVDAPEDLEFPTSLEGATVVVSVEPDPDNGPAPFTLKPLVADVPEMVADHQNLALEPGPVDITGSGSIES